MMDNKSEPQEMPREVSSFKTGDRWAFVRNNLSQIVALGKPVDFEKALFTGQEVSKTYKYECSIYHEGVTMQMLKIVRSLSVLYILIFIPSQ